LADITADTPAHQSITWQLVGSAPAVAAKTRCNWADFFVSYKL